MSEKVRYIDLLPCELRARLAQRAVAYLPLGTLEWHGEHAALGTDAHISSGLFERAAQRFGGIVLPPLFLGPDRTRLAPDGGQLIGMDTADSTRPHRRLDGSCYWASEGLFVQLCEAILAQAKRAGFRIVVGDGHGPSRRVWGERAPAWSLQYGLRVVAPGRELAGVWRTQNDHAARNETSQMLALRPDLVEMGRLPADRSEWPLGVAGEDPRDSTAAYGEECIEASLAALGDLLARAENEAAEPE